MGDLDDDVGFLLSRASGVVIRATNAALLTDRLRVRQYSVLTLACEAAEGISQRELSDTLGLDPSQVVAFVDELAASGLVERRASPTDRRAKLVTVTAKGRKARHRAEAHAASGVKDCLTALTDAEQATLRRLLRGIIASAG